MCIVVDINTLAPVFNNKCDQHENFRPVKEWIERGRGFLVFGGTRYKKELKKAFHYLRLIRQMKESGKAIAIHDDLVDVAENNVIKMTNGTDCDDQHIIALLGTSRCPLFCSNDSRSYKYITDKSLFPKSMAKVRIYSSKANHTLLKKRMSRRTLKNQA